VNDLKFSEDGSYLIAAIGQEHRLGRWSTIKSAKNSTLLIKMNLDEAVPVNTQKITELAAEQK